jgi:hypothetical protein
LRELRENLKHKILSNKKWADLIEYYTNNQDILFERYDIINGGIDNLEAWNRAFIDIGQPLGFKNAAHMQEQLKKRVLKLEVRLEQLGHTGQGGSVKHLNQVEQNLHAFVRGGREKISTVEFSLPDLIISKLLQVYMILIIH